MLGNPLRMQKSSKFCFSFLQVCTQCCNAKQRNNAPVILSSLFITFLKLLRDFLQLLKLLHLPVLLTICYTDVYNMSDLSGFFQNHSFKLPQNNNFMPILLSVDTPAFQGLYWISTTDINWAEMLIPTGCNRTRTTDYRGHFQLLISHLIYEHRVLCWYSKIILYFQSIFLFSATKPLTIISLVELIRAQIIQKME